MTNLYNIQEDYSTAYEEQRCERKGKREGKREGRSQGDGSEVKTCHASKRTGTLLNAGCVVSEWFTQPQKVERNQLPTKQTGYGD